MATRGRTQNGGREYSTHLAQAIGCLLDSLEIEYRLRVPIFSGSKTLADFAVGDSLILVGKELSAEERRRLARAGKRWLMVSWSQLRSDSRDDGLRVVQMGDGINDGRLQTIFLDDPSFNFDYAHILPKTEKCSVMHGHTSSALVEIIGSPHDGMVVDFNDAKPVIRDAIRGARSQALHQQQIRHG